MFINSIKKSLVLFTILIVVVICFSCGPLPFSRLGSGGSGSVSIIGTSSGLARSVSSGARTLMSIEPLIEDNYFKTERQELNRGMLLSSYTPEQFILDIDYILVYNKWGQLYNIDYLVRQTVQPSGGIIPRHINLIYADDFIRDFEVSDYFWNGLSMQFLPHAPSTSNDGHYVMSIVGIDLSHDYDAISLPGEITDQLNGVDPNLHYFSFDYLQPYITTFLSYLTIGEDISSAGVQNPLGEDGVWKIPGNETGGNSTQIFLPGMGIDLSIYTNPEIIFFWDMNNLIEIYDAGTVEKSDDIITFNLSNPFPVSLLIQENQDSNSIDRSGDITPPSEVYFPAISGANTYNTLQWINPKDEDFDEIVIVRRADFAPSGVNDGNIVYRGYEPNYCDTSGSSGTHYYYSIYTVDFAGNYSSGIVLDQIQH